jgi:trehalose synthase
MRAPTPPRRVQDYEGIIGKNRADELRVLAKEVSALMQGPIIMVNSTADGGGVAETLRSLVPLMTDAGVNTEWLVMRAPDEFFMATKTFHNALQGTRDASDLLMPVTDAINLYDEFHNKAFHTHNQELLVALKDAGFVVMHDPQPLAAVKHVEVPRAVRIHIDSTDPHPELKEYLTQHLEHYDIAVYTTKEFTLHPEHPAAYFTPSIDPLSDKNRLLSKAQITKLLKDVRDDRTNNPIGKRLLSSPLVTQVSRLDKWKDPEGVIEAFELLAPTAKADLVLVFAGASDDAEGAIMESKIKARVEKSPFADRIHMVRGEDPLLVNALQTKSAVVVQKSTREGFGLVVSEALIKETPVVATAVGGIPLQVIDGKTGYLVPSYRTDAAGRAIDSMEREMHIRAVAERVNHLLSNPAHAKALGRAGRLHVTEHFTTPAHALSWLSLIREVLLQKQLLAQTSEAR